MQEWSDIFDIPYPECKKTGQCCKCASPSTSVPKLIEKAASGDNFAKDFLSIFIPYNSHDEARLVSSILVDEAIRVAKKPESKIILEELVFYYCRYLSNDNSCLIYEDRPELCRNFPDSPFLVISPTCAFSDWSKACRAKYKDLQDELKRLKELKEQLKGLKYQQKIINLLHLLKIANTRDYDFVYLVPSLSLVSPAKSWLSRR